MAKTKRWRVPLPYCPLPLAYIETWMPALSAQAHAVFTVIIRATWGYQKPSDVLANAVIQKRCGLPLRSVERSLSELRKHGLIRCDGPDRHPKMITIIQERILEKPGTAYLAVRNVLTMPAKA